MGNGRWDERSWTSHSASVAHVSREKVFASRTLNAAFDPHKVQYRESRDSESNPLATPIMNGLDVTGSMGFIPEYMIKQGLGRLVTQILERRPVPDPHLMFMAIGDAFCDTAPMQLTQFEAENVIVDQIKKLWLEGGGGGNNFESYDLAWLVAAWKTVTDHWEKRQAKGYLFTVGDEQFPRETACNWVKEAFTGKLTQAIKPEDALALAQERYNVFHIIAAEGSYASSGLTRVIDSWVPHLQRRAIVLRDHTRLPELEVSIMAIEEGTDPDTVIGSWDDAEVRRVLEQSLLKAKYAR